MRKFNFFIAMSLIALISLSMVSCTGGTSPADIERHLWSEMEKGNYEKAIKYRFEHTAFEDEESKAQMQSMITALEEKMKKMYDEKEGIRNFEVIKEEIDKEDGTASVEMKITYGDGTTEETSNDYVLKDGKWMLDGTK